MVLGASSLWDNCLRESQSESKQKGENKMNENKNSVEAILYENKFYAQMLNYYSVNQKSRD